MNTGVFILIFTSSARHKPENDDFNNAPVRLREEKESHCTY
jgi:hypothetical protein